MREHFSSFGWLLILTSILLVAGPALAGGGGGGGGVTAVSVPALTPVAFAIVQAVIVVGYLIRRCWRK